VVLEQAERLEETGAGIQLSPNAARTLIDLGLEDALRQHAIAPAALRILNLASGREIVRLPLGDFAKERYGAPYWMIHRGDLLAALGGAASRRLGITVKLGLRVEDFVTHPNGITVSAWGAHGLTDERGFALLAADGVWSRLRRRLGDAEPPRFAGRIAWRSLVPAREAAPEFREPVIHLWLGRDTHLVHYPVKDGRLINVVVITADTWNEPGWSTPTATASLVLRLAAADWAMPARTLVGLADTWLKWALYDRRPLRRWSQGPAALLGDAAHPMLPYLAQGAAMAIEDAVVAAHCLAKKPDDPTGAFRAYCAARRARTRKVQRLAARNGDRYHLAGLSRWARDAGMRAMGGKHLLAHYDWIYAWRPPAAISIT
jgi:salicylate hydroxylase